MRKMSLLLSLIAVSLMIFPATVFAVICPVITLSNLEVFVDPDDICIKDKTITISYDVGTGDACDYVTWFTITAPFLSEPYTYQTDVIGQAGVKTMTFTAPEVPEVELNDSGTYLYTVTAYAGPNDIFVSAEETVNGEITVDDCSTCPELGPVIIWPPNHKEVEIASLWLPDHTIENIDVRYIYQDEPLDTYGDGNTEPDGAAGYDGWVRAERSGTKKVPGDGRVYFLGFTATVNGMEDCEYSDVNVGVPHDRKDDFDENGRLTPTCETLYESTGYDKLECLDDEGNEGVDFSHELCQACFSM